MARQPSNLASCRIERDALGERAVPADALYGVHTVRAAENFGLSGDRLSDRPALIAALGQVKSLHLTKRRDQGRAVGKTVAAEPEIFGRPNGVDPVKRVRRHGPLAECIAFYPARRQVAWLPGHLWCWVLPGPLVRV